MIWGITSTVFLFIGIVTSVYMFGIRRKYKYARFPSTPTTQSSPSIPMEQFSSLTLTPSPSPVRNPTPPRLPCVVLVEEEDYEPVARRTRSATSTKRKLMYQMEEVPEEL